MNPTTTPVTDPPAASKHPGRHPDVFTPPEAAAYLGFQSPRSLETIRENYGLTGYRVGKEYLYHREDLDACVLRMFGRERAKSAR